MVSDSDAKANLVVDTGNMAAKILVTAGRHRIVAGDSERLEKKLPFGVYKIEVTLGRQRTERLIVLRSDLTITDMLPSIVSAAPITDTARTREEDSSVVGSVPKRVRIERQAHPAIPATSRPVIASRSSHWHRTDSALETLNRFESARGPWLVSPGQSPKAKVGPGVWSFGSGSSIFFMARVWTKDDEASETLERPAANLTLRTVDDAHLVTLSHGKTSRDGRRTTCSIELTPGPYILQAKTSDGATTNQILFASPGWQTEYYLLRDMSVERRRGKKLDRRIGPKLSDLSGATVLMRRTAADDEEAEADIPTALESENYKRQLHTTEAYRVALLEGDVSVAVNRNEVLSMLSQDAVQPMLGIYAAHLMLLARESLSLGLGAIHLQSAHSASGAAVFDQSSFDRIVDRLEGMIGNTHPDFRALRTQHSAFSSAVEDTAPLLSPPMLRQSWNLFTFASRQHLELVPSAMWERTAKGFSGTPYYVWEKDRDLAQRFVTEAVRTAMEAVNRQVEAKIPQSGALEAMMSNSTAGPSSDDLHTWFQRGLGMPQSAIKKLLR